MKSRVAEIHVRCDSEAIAVIQILRCDGSDIMRLTVDQFEHHRLEAILMSLLKNCEAFLCGEKMRNT